MNLEHKSPEKSAGEGREKQLIFLVLAWPVFAGLMIVAILVVLAASFASGAYHWARGFSELADEKSNAAELPELRLGEPVDGVLRTGDALHPDDESFIDRYRFHSTSPGSVTVRMESRDLTPFLIVRGPGGLSLQRDGVTSSEDPASVALSFEPIPGQDYEVWANSRVAGETGSYRLLANPTRAGR
ncbi:MAG: hypothetical protein AAGF12_20755 [Myxococcota bacterium]